MLSTNLEAVRKRIASIIAKGEVVPHFQPIVDLTRGTILGFEGLTRGPSDTFLHSPVALFGAAQATGQLVELEAVASQRIASMFVELALPGLLFMNITPMTLVQSGGFRARAMEQLQAIGLPASRVVVELTETHAFQNTEELVGAIRQLRELGVMVALDDLGEGFSSLKRWTLMRPDYVKIDRHFMDGLSQDPLRQQFVRSILDMARSAACTVIAEGIEDESSLQLLKQMGVHCAQGYVIARPMPAPRSTVRPEIESLLMGVETTRDKGPMGRVNAGSFARKGLTVTPAVTCQEVVDMLKEDKQIYSLPVLSNDGLPLGILRSLAVLTRASGRYFLDMYGNRSCTVLMDRQPLMFDVDTSLRIMSDTVSIIDERHLVDGFIVTKDSHYFGTGRIGDLIKAVSDLQLHQARYANPLTQLPGNVPIDEHVDGLLAQRASFVVVHWDISLFKAFNDVYGYRLGDDMISFTAETLIAITDTERDFLGHVGGDDFVSIFTSADWLDRLQLGLIRFDEGVRQFFLPGHLEQGGYVALNRQGQQVFHKLPTIGAGVVVVTPGSFLSHQQIAQTASEAKRVAKMDATSSYFIDRRGPPDGSGAMADAAALNALSSAGEASANQAAPLNTTQEP